MITTNQQVIDILDDVITRLKELQEPFLQLPFYETNNLLINLEHIEEFKKRILFNISIKNRAMHLYNNFIRHYVHRNDIYIIREVLADNMDILTMTQSLKKYPNYWINIGKLDRTKDGIGYAVINYITENIELYNQLIEDEVNYNKKTIEVRMIK